MNDAQRALVRDELIPRLTEVLEALVDNPVWDPLYDDDSPDTPDFVDAAWVDATAALDRLRDHAIAAFTDTEPGSGYPPSLTIPPSAWSPCGYVEGEPAADAATHESIDSRLHAGVVINGARMHVLAIAVREVDSIQEAVSLWDRDEFDRLHAANHADGHYQTLRIKGYPHTYAVFIDGHCD